MITALVLAAGQSIRMGQPKMLLPWGKTTVLGKVIETLQQSGITEILVITGSAREEVETIAKQYTVRCIYNEEYARNEMLGSIQCGLRTIFPRPLGEGHGGEGRREGVLICLGDQPQIHERSVRLVCETFQNTKSNLVVPSHQMRRGHPWLVARPLWDELLGLKSPQSPRDFLNAHANEIEYVTVDSPTVIEDLDTPEDYLKFKP
jgi:molybdenum cofactor cytidylyltransferase